MFNNRLAAQVRPRILDVEFAGIDSGQFNDQSEAGLFQVVRLLERPSCPVFAVQ